MVRADKCDVIHALCQVRESLANPHAALAVLLESIWRRHDAAGAAEKGIDAVDPLTGQVGEFRLGIKQVKTAWAALLNSQMTDFARGL